MDIWDHLAVTTTVVTWVDPVQWPTFGGSENQKLADVQFRLQESTCAWVPGVVGMASAAAVPFPRETLVERREV